jgi:hypothetical protein
MKVDELPAYLERKRIRSSAYHLHGTGIGDEHCIEKGPRGWKKAPSGGHAFLFSVPEIDSS